MITNLVSLLNPFSNDILSTKKDQAHNKIIMKLLENQVAIVTGGARGIGAGICELFAAQGAAVFIWDLLDVGQATAERITAQGGHISYKKVDVTNRMSIRKAVDQILSKHGKIDILINNAGIVKDRSFLKMSDEEWHDVMNVNLNGIFNCTKEVIPHMKDAGYGRVVSASSINGLRGAFGQTNYSATKGAIVAFTKALAREVGKYGITVNAVAPGFVQTAMTDTIPQELLEQGIQEIPVKRPGTIEEMAHAYLYLASPQAGFTSGHTLSVNGGVH